MTVNSTSRRTGRSPARGLRIRGIAAAAAALAALAGPFAGANIPNKPDAFPPVQLLPDSKPLYSAVGVDAWDASRVAYLLLDGNVEQGYNRLHIWIPGDREYGRPVARRSDREQEFRAIEFESFKGHLGERDAERSLIQWGFNYGTRSHGSYFDYARGERVERETTVTPVFRFTCDIGIAPRSVTTRHVARMPLALTIPGEIPNVDTWERLNRVWRPWEDVRFYMRRVAQRERRRAIVRFEAGLRFYSTSWIRHEVAVVSLPPAATCTLTVSPYMQEPVFSNAIPATVAFGAGQVVDLPFGWYVYDWKLENTGLNIRSLDDYRVTLNPQPLGPFDFE